MSRSVLILVFALLVTGHGFAQWEPERTQIFSDIVITAGQKVEEATCFFCSIRVEGELRDGATAQWGDVEVSGAVDGDVIAVGGNVRLDGGSSVKGDTVSVFGDTRLSANTRVGGDAVASVGSLQVAPGVTVGKTATQAPIPVVQHLPARVRTIAVIWLTGMALSIVLGYACLLLLRKPRLERLASTMKTRRWRTVVLGISVFGLLVAALQVGGDSKYEDRVELPLIILLLALMAPGYTAMSLHVAEACFGGNRFALLIGIFGMVSLQVLPIVGWILAPVLMIFSLGSLPASIAWRLPANTAPAENG